MCASVNKKKRVGCLISKKKTVKEEQPWQRAANKSQQQDGTFNKDNKVGNTCFPLSMLNLALEVTAHSYEQAVLEKGPLKWM